MKAGILALTALLSLSSCSSPRYSYYFDRPIYSSGKEKLVVINEPFVPAPETSRLMAGATPVFNELSANSTRFTGRMKETSRMRSGAKAQEIMVQRTMAMEAKAVRSDPAVSMMDKDLKRSAIFGALGIVTLVIGGSVFGVIGSLSLMIGLIFLLKWLLRH